MEVYQFLKVQIKGKSRLKTDFYNDISFDLGGLNTVLWFDSICRTYSIMFFSVFQRKSDFSHV